MMLAFRPSAILVAIVFYASLAQAEDLRCGKPKGGQFAEETLCASILLMPDGSPANDALLNAIPDQYPWVFRLSDSAPPSLTIQLAPIDVEFTQIGVLNGYAAYDTTGSEQTPFARFGRAKDVLIETAAGHSHRVELADNDQMQFIPLPQPAANEWVRLTVLSSYAGEGDLVAIRWFSIPYEGDL
jgi:hypothetical protein